MGPASEQFHRGDAAGRPAAHAVINGDHLGHGGHGHLAADDPCAGAADGQGHDRQRKIDRQVGPGRRIDAEYVKEARQDGGDHADARHADSGRGCRRRRHALETEQEQEGRGEIGRADGELGDHGEHDDVLNSASSGDAPWRDHGAAWRGLRWT